MGGPTDQLTSCRIMDRPSHASALIFDVCSLESIKISITFEGLCPFTLTTFFNCFLLFINLKGRPGYPGKVGAPGQAGPMGPRGQMGQTGSPGTPGGVGTQFCAAFSLSLIPRLFYAVLIV